MKQETKILTNQGWITPRQLAAIQTSAREGYVVAPPAKEDDDTAYKKRGHGVPNNVRKAVYKRDGYRCALCDSTNGLQIHHVVKRSLGGSDHPHNLIALCWKCHAVAHGQRFDEYPEHINADWMEQACVEYVSDYYAEQGEPWYPFK